MEKLSFEYKVEVWKKVTFDGDESAREKLIEAIRNGWVDEAIDLAVENDGEFMTLFDTEESTGAITK